MLARVYSCAVLGLEVVFVEVDFGTGLPNITPYKDIAIDNGFCYYISEVWNHHVPSASLTGYQRHHYV